MRNKMLVKRMALNLLNEKFKQLLQYIKEEDIKAKYEDGILKMPDSDAIRADFRSVRKTSSATGAVRFLAERDGNGHADRFWACALALNAGAKPNESYFVPIERRSDRRFF